MLCPREEGGGETEFLETCVYRGGQVSARGVQPDTSKRTFGGEGVASPLKTGWSMKL